MSATFASAHKEETNYLCVICEHCKKSMTLDEHSVILGSKWYHAECFGVRPEGQ
ncbi:MAG: hypothetical protein HZC29_03885 [Thaumarchaeota archaeon]|nr:hypothetical protein [Nitrososphaerota archaeon]